MDKKGEWNREITGEKTSDRGKREQWGVLRIHMDLDSEKH